MKHTECRNFLYTLAVVAYVSVPPSTAAAVLERPIIKLTSPNGGLVWVSGHAEVTWGYSFIFNCSFTSSGSPGSFILKFSSQDISKNRTSQSNTFNFSAAEYDQEGNYSCVYTGNRNNTSPESDPIYVIIKYPLLKLLIYSVVPGAALLLLVVVLIVVLVYRRRRRDRRPEDVILTRTAVRNRYSDEEEEQDYINVDPGDNNRKSNLVANEEDGDEYDYENLKDEKDNDYENQEDEKDNDYENQEDEKDNDYENQEDEKDNDYENQEDDNDYENPEDEDDNVKATKAAVTAKIQREEDCDEEESSGDEHDYVNLAESISEQTLDIYDGEQDIY